MEGDALLLQRLQEQDSVKHSKNFDCDEESEYKPSDEINAYTLVMVVNPA